MAVLTAIWEAISTSATSAVAWIVQMFSGLAELFYIPATEGGEGGLTFIGVFAVIALVVAVCFIVIKWISSFVTLNRY